MLLATPLLCALAGGSPTRLDAWVAGGRETLDRPAGTDWDEGEIGAALHRGRWWTSLSAHGVRRYGIEDGEILAAAGREHDRLGWEVGAGRGIQETFLPVWMLRSSLHAFLGRSWNATFSQKTSIHEDLTVIQPEFGAGFRIGRIGLGARGIVPLADGDPLDAGWQILSDISWSDAAASGASFGRWTEAETAERGGIVRTRVTSGSLSSRLRIGATTVRIGAGWTRQGSSHDRLGANLGLSHAFAL